MERYEMCGGVLRSILGCTAIDLREEIEKALIFKGPIIAAYFFKHGFGGVDTDTDYLLIHLNPRYSEEEGRYLYSAPPKYGLASDYVLRELTSKHQTAFIC